MNQKDEDFFLISVILNCREIDAQSREMHIP